MGDDARDVDNYALGAAAEKNHLSVIQELRVGYGLTRRDGRAALNSAAKNCDSRDIFREFRSNWGLDLSDLSPDDYFVLKIIASHGCLDLLRELIANWGLSALEVKSALVTAARFGEISILRELKLLGLTANDAVNTAALNMAAEHDHDLVL